MCGQACYGTGNTTISEEHIQHFILVIWPKRESSRMYCRYGLHSDLQELAFRSSTRWLKESVQKATEDLRAVISVCSSDPWHMWKQTGFRKGKLTERLLRLCIDLGARKEGLALLKLLGTDFPLPQEGTSNTQKIFEGIQTKKVAKAIVEFECRVTGWSECADLIEKMISPNRIVEQLMPTIKLAHFFLKFDCLEGANFVGDRISSAFMNVDKSQAHKLALQHTDIWAYLEFIFSLEANPKTSNHERMRSFASFFSKLEFSVLCDLLPKMEAQSNSRHENSESRKNMFYDLCKALTDCDLRSPRIKKAAVDLICSYFSTGNAELLRSFLFNIVRAHVASKENEIPSKTLLEKVISSPEILNLDLSSDLGEIFMEVLVDSQLTTMEKETSTSANILDYGSSLLSTNLSSCIRLAIVSGNQERMKSFASFFSKLESSVLCDLLLKMEAQANSRHENSESRKNMFNELCKALSDCDLRSPCIKEKTVVDLICCCFRTGNAELLRSFLSNIVRAHVASKENESSAKTLLEKVISSPEILNLELSSDLGEIIMEVLVDSQLTTMEKETSASANILDYESSLLSTNLSSCIRLAIVSGKNTRILDARRAMPIASILEKLNVYQLTVTFTDLLKNNSKRLKACPSYPTMISLIGNSLVSELKKNARDILSRRTLLEVLDVFIESGVASLTQSLIKQVCANEESGTRSQQEKYGLFAGLISIPRVWEILDSKSKLIILKTCGSLIQTWIIDMSCSINEHAIQKLPEQNEILNCIQFFFLVERNRIKNERTFDNPAFEPLIANLSVSLLMDLVLHLQQSKSETIKNFPACFNFYRDTSRHFFTMEFMPLVEREGAIRLLNLLMWLEDEQSWQSFATSVSTAFPSTSTYIFLRLFLKNPVIKQSLKDSSLAFAGFASIVDNCSFKSASLKEPPFSWNQPEAVVSRHPEVQAFLRSNQASMTYMKFTGIAEAHHFAAYLMRGSKNLSVSVTTSGSGQYSRCVITKTRNHNERDKDESYVRKGELELLVKLRERLGQENLKTKRVTADEVSVVPPPKRPKREKI